ncbi:MAG: hypothetical protein ACPG61_07285 [Paracoccaceae bacterium]
MVDVARLAVAVDSSDLATGKAALRGFATEGKRTEAQIVKSADRMERELAQTAVAAQKVSKGFGGNGMRMAAMQLSQVGQQTMATGNFVQALSIQLPDLALGFGAVGIMAGVAAGALLPLAVNMFTAGDNAEAAEEALDSFAGAVEDYKRAAEMATLSTQSLREEFGQYGEELRGTLEILQQIALSRALDGMGIAVEQIDVERLRTLVNVFRDGASEMSIVSETYNKALAALRDEYEMTGEQASAFLDRLNELGQAQGPEEVSRAIREVNDLLLETFGSVQGIPPALQEMVQHLAETDVAASRLLANMQDSEASAANLANTDIASNIGAGANEAARLAEWLGISLSRAMSLAATTPTMADEDALMSQPVTPDAGTRASQRTAVTNFLRLTAPKSGGGSRGGGGGGTSQAARDATKAQNELNREAERIIESLKDDQDKYNDSIEQANRLLKAGALTQEQYNKHVEQLGVELQEVQFEKIQRGVEDISDAIAGAIVNGEDLGEAFGNIVKKMASDLISSGIQSLIMGLFDGGGSTGGGGGFFGLLGGLFGGFKADGGPVSSGKSYIVGERGPELFSPGTSGSITPNEKLGGGSVSINVNVAGASGDNHVRELVKEGVLSGLSQYDNALPQRVKGITSDPRAT